MDDVERGSTLRSRATVSAASSPSPFTPTPRKRRRRRQRQKKAVPPRLASPPTHLTCSNPSPSILKTRDLCPLCPPPPPPPLTASLTLSATLPPPRSAPHSRAAKPDSCPVVRRVGATINAPRLCPCLPASGATSPVSFCPPPRESTRLPACPPSPKPPASFGLSLSKGRRRRARARRSTGRPKVAR